MDVEFEMQVFDKNGEKLGEIDKIVNDMWTGEPRKFMVRVEEGTDAFFFTPDQIGKVEEGKVTLNIVYEKLEQTE